MRAPDRLRAALSRYNLIPVALLVFVAGVIVNPSFIDPINILAILLDTAIYGFLVLGEGLTVLTGGIDLSVGNMASLSSVVAVWTMNGLGKALPEALGVAAGILAALAFCGLIGFLAGLSIGHLRLPPIIATLGSMWLVQGLAYWFLKGVPGVFRSTAFKEIFGGNVLFLPWSFLYLLLAAALIVRWLTGRRTGRWVYAVGGNEYAAAISGIKVAWIKVGVYTASALLAGVSGILVGAYSSVGYPRACSGYELYAIAAVVMGGIAFSGGEGNLWNALLGVLVLRLLNKLVIFSGLSGYFEGMVVGAILVFTLLVDSRRASLRHSAAHRARPAGKELSAP